MFDFKNKIFFPGEPITQTAYPASPPPEEVEPAGPPKTEQQKEPYPYSHKVDLGPEEPPVYVFKRSPTETWICNRPEDLIWGTLTPVDELVDGTALSDPEACDSKDTKRDG